MTCHCLLITTSFSFLELDVVTDVSRCLHRGHGLYYGIAKSAENVFVAARRRLVSSDVPIESERGEIIVFDTKLREVDRLMAAFPLRDMHEISWHDSALWVTCSYDNMIAIFDGKKWHQWYPLGEPTEVPRDRNHFNSFLFEDNRMWILAHNNGASALLAFDSNTRVLIDRVELGNQAHNIRRQGGELLTCSSGEERVVGNCGFSLETGGFPRGIAQSVLGLYVGISERAERKDRELTSGAVLLYGENKEVKKRIELRGEGMVLDLMPWDRDL